MVYPPSSLLSIRHTYKAQTSSVPFSLSLLSQLWKCLFMLNDTMPFSFLVWASHPSLLPESLSQIPRTTQVHAVPMNDAISITKREMPNHIELGNGSPLKADRPLLLLRSASFSARMWDRAQCIGLPRQCGTSNK